MKNILLSLCLTFLVTLSLFSQSSLTIEKIMQGEKFTGFSPSEIQWAPTGNLVYFNWNPAMENVSSLYTTNAVKPAPVKVTIEQQKNLPAFRGTYNRSRYKDVICKRRRPVYARY